ncbi:MAG: DUF1349 domain-containing protein, partial [Chloroflexi bacterium]|nr:DUF1349 domain-containing protein [Chloroflexota bacterium]
NGSITKNPDQTSHTDGTAVTLQAVPDLGWTFVGWSGDLTGSVNPETITMNSHKTVTATFEAEAYTLNVTEVGGGSVSLNPDQPIYRYDDDVTLQAKPDPGWQFDGWSGDLTGSSTSTNITMDGNKAVTATFSEILCSLPSPWLSGDIGSVAAAGKACEESGTYTVLGSGKDIWKTSDEFHFMFQSFNGDGEIIARITSQTDTNDWAKAGVMIRESLGANSAYAFTALTPANGLHYQYRSNTGVDAAGGGNAGGSAPVWLKMERIGNVFTSYHSTDGSSWTQIGSTTIAMGTNVYFGLAVSSHDTPGNGEISTGTFTNVAINPITPSGPNCSSPTGSLLVRINYQPSGNPVPAGYAVDGGDAYGNRGNGFSYGWN